MAINKKLNKAIKDPYEKAKQEAKKSAAAPRTGSIGGDTVPRLNKAMGASSEKAKQEAKRKAASGVSASATSAAKSGRKTVAAEKAAEAYKTKKSAAAPRTGSIGGDTVPRLNKAIKDPYEKAKQEVKRKAVSGVSASATSAAKSGKKMVAAEKAAEAYKTKKSKKK